MSLYMPFSLYPYLSFVSYLITSQITFYLLLYRVRTIILGLIFVSEKNKHHFLKMFLIKLHND